uniref:Uncharacterized protein n=1 Tax=Syphacia muris TaxID=451379 RepID=A0A0N5AEU9_9BILA
MDECQWFCGNNKIQTAFQQCLECLSWRGQHCLKCFEIEL